MKKNYLLIIIAGVVTGIAALLLSAGGNPANMGLCIACFLRDISGALGFHGAAAVQYVRPEIIGLVAGSTIAAIAAKEFKPKGGSSPMTRFLIGVFVMIGALVFLGCPLRMMIRIGGGDLNALIGLCGFAAGIGVGILVLRKGFTLKRAYPQGMAEGGTLPVLMVALLVMFLVVPSLFKDSTEGPGSMHAPILLALMAGLIVGTLAQRTRLCTVGGIRDAMMFRDYKLLTGFAAIIITVIIGNLILGKFKLGFLEQPVAHTDGVWNFLGMTLVGWGSVLLGGCPLRQLILAGEGNSDSAVTVIGFIAGAAIAHNFGLASSAKGPTPGGMITTAAGFAVLALISVFNIAKTGKE